MNILRKLRRWCPQPTKPILNNSTRLSSPVVAGVLFIEIVALLIAPIAYFALFPPHVTYQWETIPLSNSQIAASWPNLPTANQIISSGTVPVGGPAFPVNNSTQIGFIDGGFDGGNVPNLEYTPTGIPILYHIWLNYNGTWIQVPSTYLATDNPPLIPTLHSGFLGNGLPTEYVIIAIIAIVATSATGTAYLRLKKKSVLT